MSEIPIDAPADFAPVTALAFADADSTAIYVGTDHPLPVGELPYRGAIALLPDVDQAPGRGVAIAVTIAGTVCLKLADDSLLSLPMEQGLSILPFAAKSVISMGTTAAASAHILV